MEKQERLRAAVLYAIGILSFLAGGLWTYLVFKALGWW